MTQSGRARSGLGVTALEEPGRDPTIADSIGF
jgi:hypothetical protein